MMSHVEVTVPPQKGNGIVTQYAWSRYKNGQSTVRLVTKPLVDLKLDLEKPSSFNFTRKSKQRISARFKLNLNRVRYLKKLDKCAYFVYFIANPRGKSCLRSFITAQDLVI